MDENEWIPHHEVGEKTSTTHSATCASEEEARVLLQHVRHRLMDVNSWTKLAGAATADFRLVDSAGQHVERLAQQGDYFQIDIPGPGSSAGKGHDWVRIELIEEAEEGAAIRVRPAVPPGSGTDDVAHFFTDASTSSFIVWREGCTVTAGVYGRNEVPNTEVSSLGDKIRNAAIAVGAFLGLSKLQWKNLVKGLIEGA